MQRYFIKSEQLVDDQAVITGDDVHHILNVMRASIGDKLILCTCDKTSYLVQITALSKAEVKVQVVEKKELHVELPVFVTIAQGMTKGDKFDWVLQKATECGASAFVPVAMKRSVAKVEVKKVAQKVERWQKIVLAAARQSHRQVVPTVYMPATMKSLVTMATEYDVCLFAYEACDMAHQGALADAIRKFEPEMRVLIVIGSEGGIEPSEVDDLRKAGFTAVGLGPRILRTETAPIYIMSAISYALEIEGRRE